MSTVKWLVVRCRMYLFRLPDYPIPIDQVAIWRFGNRTKYIKHRTTSHLTADICDSPVYLSKLWEAYERWDVGRGIRPYQQLGASSSSRTGHDVYRDFRKRHDAGRGVR